MNPNSEWDCSSQLRSVRKSLLSQRTNWGSTIPTSQQTNWGSTIPTIWSQEFVSALGSFPDPVFVPTVLQEQQACALITEPGFVPTVVQDQLACASTTSRVSSEAASSEGNNCVFGLFLAVF